MWQKFEALRLAALAASIISGSAAAEAADLAGDCCADLEERIAKLQAAAARRGNRKVSLTITGYVTKQVMFWDDGAESNAYISDIGPTQATNLRLPGEATIAPGWKAGYLMRIQDLSENSMGLSQSASVLDQGLNVQMSYWYVANKELGKLSVGKNAMAAKARRCLPTFRERSSLPTMCCSTAAASSCAATAHRSAYAGATSAICYSQARPGGGDCHGIVMEGVRYDSPTLAGFSWLPSPLFERIVGKAYGPGRG